MFERNIVNIFLAINLTYVLCAQKNRLFRVPTTYVWLRNKKFIFLLRTLNLSPAVNWLNITVAYLGQSKVLFLPAWILQQLTFLQWNRIENHLQLVTFFFLVYVPFVERYTR